MAHLVIQTFFLKKVRRVSKYNMTCIEEERVAYLNITLKTKKLRVLHAALVKMETLKRYLAICVKKVCPYADPFCLHIIRG